MGFEESDDEWGTTTGPPMGEIVPFPRMRPSTALRERWAAALQKANQRNSTNHKMLSPLEVVPRLMELREMQPMAWPADWPGLASRARIYPGECIGIVGPMGGGKTSFAMQIARANCATGTPCLWLALELGAPQIITRIAGNMASVHSMHVRDQWSRERLDSALTSIDDMFRFIDKCSDLNDQLRAIEISIAICREVYGKAPLVVIDHVGVAVAKERDERQAMLALLEQFSEMAERTGSIIMPLAQVSVVNQGMMTGKIDVEAASDALGASTGGKAMGQACATVIDLVVFKVDDAPVLDAHALVSKTRHTGKEGREGMRFSKAGGVWSELDYLPTTPNQAKAGLEKAKKDKHRTGPEPTLQQIRSEMNLNVEGDARASQRHVILQAIRRHGALGMETSEIRKLDRSGRGAAQAQSLQELERAGAIERYGTKYRAVTRIE